MKTAMAMTPDFFVCSKCLSGFREDVRADIEATGRVNSQLGCTCGGTYRRTPAVQAIGSAAGAADGEAASQALTQLLIARVAHEAGDEGSAWSAVDKATRLLRSLLGEESPS